MAMFLIHQSIHFWGASTAKPGNLHLIHAEQVHVERKSGNLNNIRNCNGKEFLALTNKDGVLAVECSRNSGQSHPHVPHADGFKHTNIATIPKNTSDDRSTDRNGGITTLVEVKRGKEQNDTITEEKLSTMITLGVSTNAPLSTFN
jgi:hypothetical protein